MTLTCIIIEDEPLAMEKLQGFIDKIPSLGLQGSFNNAIDGLKYFCPPSHSDERAQLSHPTRIEFQLVICSILVFLTLGLD